MKRILQTVYLTQDSIDLIDKDINAKQSYTVFANQEEGTIPVSITLEVMETFKISEDMLEGIIDGLLPALSEAELEKKKEQVKSHLRSVGASV